MGMLYFLAQVLTSVIAAFLAAWLASRRFKTERWWERKLNAYVELIDALHSVKWRASEHFDAALEQRDLEDEYSQEISLEQAAARRKVWRIADTASFLISEEVLAAVQEMERGLSDSRSAESWFEHLDTQQHAADVCIKRVKKIGAKELGFK